MACHIKTTPSLLLLQPKTRRLIVCVAVEAWRSLDSFAQNLWRLLIWPNEHIWLFLYTKKHIFGPIKEEKCQLWHSFLSALGSFVILLHTCVFCSLLCACPMSLLFNLVFHLPFFPPSFPAALSSHRSDLLLFFSFLCTSCSCSLSFFWPVSRGVWFLVFFGGFFLHVFEQPSRGRHRRPTHFSKSAWLSGSAATTCQEDVSVFFHDECRRMFTCCSLRHSLMCDRNTDVFLHAFCEISRLKARFQPPSPSWSSLRFYLWVSEPARLCVATCLLWPGNAVSPEQQDGP